MRTVSKSRRGGNGIVGEAPRIVRSNGPPHALSLGGDG